VNHQTDDTRIDQIMELLPPVALMERYPLSATAEATVVDSRQAIHNILTDKDDRLLVIVGPCSIHDTKAALEYAAKLKTLRAQYAGELEVVMRVYFEKPRTTVGWKGLINDPHMDGSFKINEGLRVARELLCNINDMGLPTAGEFLDVISPQYVADLTSWGAIGARRLSHKCIENYHRVCLVRLDLKMVPMAVFELLLMVLAQLIIPTIFYR